MPIACFLSPTSFPLLSPSTRLSSIPRVQNSSPRRRRRVKVHPKCLFNSNTPRHISDLDDNLPAPNPMPLSPKAEAYLLDNIPSLRNLKPDYSQFPADGRVFTWYYHQCRRRTLLYLARIVFLIGSVSGGVVYAVRRYGIDAVLLFLVQFELLLNTILLVVVPTVLVIWALLNNRVYNDGARRSILMHTLSSLLLVPISMIASVGKIYTALAAGILTRIVHMGGSLWLWKDLRSEIVLGNSKLVHVFRMWRSMVTWGVLVLGSVIRVMAWKRESVAAGMGIKALEMRLGLGDRFPTMLSLCNDPRGLFFAATLMLGIALVYLFYLTVYSMDLGRERRHREVGSVLTQVMEKVGAYRESKPKEARVVSGEGSLLPSTAMLLRKREGMGAESRFLSEVERMPAYDLLDKEEEILEKEGASVWMKGRYDWIDGDIKQKSTAVLNAWASEMKKGEEDMRFDEFFESLAEEEYKYDEESGDWVFEFDEEMKNIAERVLTAMNENDLKEEELEKLLQKAGVDLRSVAMQPGIDPEVRKHILSRLGEGDDGETVLV